MKQNSEAILEETKRADDRKINEIVHAVVKRYKTVFPDWEVMFLSLPKNDPEERRCMIESTLDFLRRHTQINIKKDSRLLGSPNCYVGR